MFDTIDKKALRPGDIVGIKRPTRLVWGFFRYPQISIMTIERITPDRTKFVMTNGAEFGKRELFYRVTEEMQRQSHIAECAETISTCLNKSDDLKRNGKLFSVDDATIERVSELILKICDEVR